MAVDSKQDCLFCKESRKSCRSCSATVCARHASAVNGCCQNCLDVIQTNAEEGRCTSIDEDDELEAIGGADASLYSEMTTLGFRTLATKIALSANDIFVDLGSGLGRCVFQAAREFGVRRSFGVELAGSRHELALTMLKLEDAAVAERVQLLHGNCADPTMWDEKLGDLTDVTAVFISSTLFSEQLMCNLARQIEETPSVRTVATLTSFPSGEEPWGFAEELPVLKCETSWTAPTDLGVPVYEQKQPGVAMHIYSRGAKRRQQEAADKAWLEKRAREKKEERERIEAEAMATAQAERDRLVAERAARLAAIREKAKAAFLNELQLARKIAGENVRKDIRSTTEREKKNRAKRRKEREKAASERAAPKAETAASQREQPNTQSMASAVSFRRLERADARARKDEEHSTTESDARTPKLSTMRMEIVFADSPRSPTAANPREVGEGATAPSPEYISLSPGSEAERLRIEALLGATAKKVGLDGHDAVLSSLQSTSVVNWSKRNLRGEDGFAIAAALQMGDNASRTLTALDLRQNSFPPEASQKLASVVVTIDSLLLFGNIPVKKLRQEQLARLDLKSCSLGSTEFCVLGNLLSVSTRLAVLRLRDNVLEPNAAVAFGEALKLNSSLRELDLCRNHLCGVQLTFNSHGSSIGTYDCKGLRRIADGITHGSSALAQLSLRDNRIGAEGAITLSKALLSAGGGKRALTSLDIAVNSIEAAGAQAIGMVLESSTCSLQTLNMADNDIGKLGGRAIADALVRNTSLTSLSIAANAVGVDAAKAIAAAVVKSERLTRFSGIPLDKIASGVRMLDLSSRGLGLPEAFVIAEFLTSYESLVHVRLQSNFVVNPMLDRAALRAIEGANGRRTSPARLVLSEHEVAWHAARRESLGAIGSEGGLLTPKEVEEARYAPRRGSAISIDSDYLLSLRQLAAEQQHPQGGDG